MIDIILGIVILAILVLVVWLERLHDKERTKLINALIAKTAQDHANLQMADRTTIDLKKVEEDLQKALSPDDDLIPMSMASDDLFDEAIKNEQEDFNGKING